MFDSWTLNSYIIANVLTVVMVLVSYFTMLAKDR